MQDEQLLRYSRQIMLAGFDIAAQEALLNASVLILGLGGLGCPVAAYLAAAGVGELILVDDDEVDLTNLQRQVLHTTADIGRAKVSSAGDYLKQLNPDLKVTEVKQRLTEGELLAWVKQVDLLVDCSDNFGTRFLTNRVALKAGKPLVSGAAIRYEGQLASYRPGAPDSPCYACLYGDQGDEDLTCSESGVLAPVVGVMGSMQALEAIKLLTGVGQPLVGRLMIFDALTMDWRTMKLPRDPECSVCADHQE